MKRGKNAALSWLVGGVLMVLSTQVSALCLIPALCASTGYTQTKHPIVLVHGLIGFDNIGPIQYWHGIPQGLSKDGAKVYVAAVLPVNSTEARGEQLVAHLRMLKASYGHTKFNLIGHSHGGPTIRYAAGVAPDLVASVLVVGSPNQGAGIADAIENEPLFTGPAVTFFNTVGTVISLLGGKPASQVNTMNFAKSVSTRGMQDFNRRFPGGQPTQYCGSGAPVANGVHYYSLSGTSLLTNAFDSSDASLAVAGAVFDAGKQTDGMVERCSSRWGVVLRDNYPWNHLDEVNMMFGLRAPFSPDPVAVYRTHANRLKQAGL